MATTPYEAQAIGNLQRYLRQLARFDPSIPMINEDGLFGEKTRATLTAFQRGQGLPETGKADPETWERLFSAYEASIEAHARPLPLYVFPRFPEDYTVGRGDTGLLTEMIQLLLRDILLLYGRETSLPSPNGSFDEETEQAVKVFQTLHRLPVNGRIDRGTWNRLARVMDLQNAAYPHP